MLFGGTDSSIGDLNETWSIDGQRATQVNASTLPMKRSHACLSWNEGQQKAVLFGGMSGREILGDTWLYNEGEWVQQQPLNSPSPRFNANMEYDGFRNRAILFGGFANTGKKFYESNNDTWAWDGQNWQQQFPTTLPPSRSASNLIYDRERKSMLLFGGVAGGGFLGDTWMWDGTDWLEQNPSHHPPARSDFGMAYHEEKQQIIVFGGQSFGGMATDTWIWDGKDWDKLDTLQSPPPQIAYGAHLVYLPIFKAVALYNVYREKTIISDEKCEIIERFEVWVLNY